MKVVVEGPDHRSRGIQRCWLQRMDLYDHKRAVAEKKKGAAVADTEYWIWDFVMERDDGTYVALHPNYKNTTVECRSHLPTPDDELPNTGAWRHQRTWDCSVLYNDTGRL